MNNEKNFSLYTYLTACRQAQKLFSFIYASKITLLFFDLLICLSTILVNHLVLKIQMCAKTTC